MDGGLYRTSTSLLLRNGEILTIQCTPTGALAQLVERINGIDEANGSTPLRSIRFLNFPPLLDDLCSYGGGFFTPGSIAQIHHDNQVWAACGITK